jgi:ParB-like chromosome segregation protein Spo0J
MRRLVQPPSVEALRPYANNARTHSKKQIRQIGKSIERFGFNNPVLIDDQGQIIAGHGRVAAAKQLGISVVPTVRLSHLSETEKRAYILADNRLAEKAGWDRENPGDRASGPGPSPASAAPDVMRIPLMAR